MNAFPSFVQKVVKSIKSNNTHSEKFLCIASEISREEAPELFEKVKNFLTVTGYCFEYKYAELVHDGKYLGAVVMFYDPLCFDINIGQSEAGVMPTFELHQKTLTAV